MDSEIPLDSSADLIQAQCTLFFLAFFAWTSLEQKEGKRGNREVFSPSLSGFVLKTLSALFLQKICMKLPLMNIWMIFSFSVISEVSTTVESTIWPAQNDTPGSLCHNMYMRLRAWEIMVSTGTWGPLFSVNSPFDADSRRSIIIEEKDTNEGGWMGNMSFQDS